MPCGSTSFRGAAGSDSPAAASVASRRGMGNTQSHEAVTPSSAAARRDQPHSPVSERRGDLDARDDPPLHGPGGVGRLELVAPLRRHLGDDLSSLLLRRTDRACCLLRDGLSAMDDARGEGPLRRGDESESASDDDTPPGKLPPRGTEMGYNVDHHHLSEWGVEVPLRFRGRASHGTGDVMLELLRVRVGREPPCEAPRRGCTLAHHHEAPGRGLLAPFGRLDTRGNNDKNGREAARKRGKGGGRGGRMRRALDALIDTGETAAVLACFGAASPDGAAKISSALAVAGAAWLAVDLAAARGSPSDSDARFSDSEGLGRFGVPGSAAAAAVASRFCGGALALRVSGVALRLVSPALHTTLKCSAALGAVKVVFAQPDRPRGDDGGGGTGSPMGRGSGDGVDWHRRYRWAALRLSPLIPRTPSEPMLKHLFALVTGAALVVQRVGDHDLAGTGLNFDGFRGEGGGEGWGTGGGGVSAGGGGRIACYRLCIDFASRRKKGRKGARHGARDGGMMGRKNAGDNLAIALIDLDQVTTSDILHPPPPEPNSTSTSTHSTPKKQGHNRSHLATPRTPSPRSLESRVATLAPLNAPRGTGSSTLRTPADSAGGSDVSANNGDIWHDERYTNGSPEVSTLQIVSRGAYLALAFAPTFALSVPLLILSEWEPAMRFLGFLGGFREDVNARGQASRAAAARAAMRRFAWSTLHFSVSLCGAALVKWAQWASVRNDVFPEDFCEAMSALHDDAPRHSMRETERILKEELGVPLAQVFAHFPDEPVASGSIAQVYRCTLRPEVATACSARDPELARRLRANYKMWEEGQRSMLGHQDHGRQSYGSAGRSSSLSKGLGFWLGFGSERTGAGNGDTEALAAAAVASLGRPEGCVVAVKVRHPGVDRQIFLDFQILKKAARLFSGISVLKGLNLEETLGQFSHTMTAQTDLRTEARNLRRFGRNFRKAHSVRAPWPIVGLVTEGVLCETFERGEALSGAIRRGGEHNRTLCAYGVDTYLKMLLRDNFLHSDLHPGNILYDFHQPNPSIPGQVRLTLLDFGIADELPVVVRDNFLTFLFCLVHKDGIAAADTILGWSSDQKCKGNDAEALRRDMCELVNNMCDVAVMRVDIDSVLKAVMSVLRRHGVSIDAVYATLIVSMCVLVGFAKSLDDELNLFEVSISALLSYTVTGDVVGKLFDK